MKKKVLIGICLLCLAGVMTAGIILFRAQYNVKGIGKYLCIEIDQSGFKEIGQEDGINIMTYDLKMPYFICVNAKQINLDTALQQGDIQIEDLYRYAVETAAVDLDGEKGTSYLYENYQVVIGKEVCIIAPKDVNIFKFPDKG